MRKKRICILGSGRVGTACALRLYRAGFEVCITEKHPPTDIYYHQTFSGAFFSGRKVINEITARTLAGAVEAGNVEPGISLQNFISYQFANREIALLNLNESQGLKNFPIDYVVKTRSESFTDVEQNIAPEAKWIATGRQANSSPVHYPVADDELYGGQVIYPFLQDTIALADKEKEAPPHFMQVKAPLEGVFVTLRRVDDFIREKEEIGKINDLPILSPVTGHLSGLLNSGMMIPPKTVFAELNTGKEFVPDAPLPVRAFALAGGVLEAVLFDINL